MECKGTLVGSVSQNTLRLAVVVLGILALTGMTNAQGVPTVFFTQTQVVGSLNGNQAFQPNTLTSSTTYSQTGESGSATANLPSGALAMQMMGSLNTTDAGQNPPFALAAFGDDITATGNMTNANLGVNITVNGTSTFSDPTQNLTYVIVAAWAPDQYGTSAPPIFAEGFVIGNGTMPYGSWFAKYGLTYGGAYGSGTQNIQASLPFATLGSTFQIVVGIATAENATAITTYNVKYTAQVSLSAPGGVTLASGSGLFPGAISTPTIPTYSGSVLYGPSNDAVAGPAPCTSGDPVNCATGNLVESQVDLAVRGRGRPLNLVRTLNGLDAASASSPRAIGFGWTHSYAAFLAIDGAGNVTVNRGNGSTVPFTKSGSAFTAPAFVIATLVLNQDGTYTFTLPNQNSEIFSSTGRLMTETDRNGYKTALAYDGSGNLISVTDPAGRSLSFAYGANGLLASVTDPNGRKVSYTYDSLQNLISVTDAGGNVTGYAYDSLHRLVSMTTPNGAVATNVYDGNSRVVSQTDPAGRTMTFAYGTGTTTITDGDGHVTTQTYIGNRLTALTRGAGTPLAATWSFTYDAAGNRISGTDPNGNAWNATYDAHGNRLAFTDALGRTTASTFDAQNNPLSRIDPAGVTTTYTYDAHGNLATISRPLTGTSQIWTQTFQHGDASHPGDITAIVGATGATWTRTYNANGDLIKRVDPDNDIWGGNYNGIGWLTSEVMPRGNANGSASAFTITHVYSPLGQTLQTTDQLGHVTKFSYDANRNLVSKTDADGHVTNFAYDPDNKLIKTTRADGSVLATSFDQAGNMIGQTDGLGRTTSYGYDALNRQISVTDPLSRTTQYGYDGAGNRTSIINASSETTSMTYDAANQLRGITYSDSMTPAVSFTYDLDGERVAMTDGTGASAYQFDSLHRLTSATDGGGLHVGYTYDLRGDLTGITYPSGKQVIRGFDVAGRLTSVADWLGNKSTFQYDPDGNSVGIGYGNGINGAFGYDRDDREISITYPFWSFAYTRDNLGLITQVNPGGLIGNKYSYTQINEVSATRFENFSYDPADNLTKIATEGLSYDVANELTKEAGMVNTTLSYDARGNRLTAPGSGQNYRYDQANRLTALGSQATYSYNGVGLRTAKVLRGTAESFVWDLAEGLPLLLEDGSTQFIYGAQGLPLEQINRDGSVFWFHHDQLGSTRALTNSHRNVVGLYGYTLYGQRPLSNGDNDGDDGLPAKTPLLFAGQYTDLESGLQYLRARYYDPSTGQFLTRDPSNMVTRTPYLYASGDPVNRADASGLDDSGSDTGSDVGSGAGAGSDPGLSSCSVGANGGTDGTEVAANPNWTWWWLPDLLSEAYDYWFGGPTNAINLQAVQTALAKYQSANPDWYLDGDIVNLQQGVNGKATLSPVELQNLAPGLLKVMPPPPTRS